MDIIDTKIPDCKIIVPKKFKDNRGYFIESWNVSALANMGIDIAFKQDNHSYSAKKNTIRGLHYQSPPCAQDKLIRVAVGSILDVAVDIRVGSPTYGQWVSEYLSEDNGKQLLVPKGFLHGFITYDDNVHVVYKCSEVYAPSADGTIRFDDPILGVDWQQDAPPILSDKDMAGENFSNFKSPFVFGS